MVTENRALTNAANKIIKLTNKRELKKAESDAVRNSLQNIKLDLRFFFKSKERLKNPFG